RWNCTIEERAQKYIDHCVFKHSTSNERNGAGENLYSYWTSGSDEEAVATAGTSAGSAWWSELGKYYKNNPNNTLTIAVFDLGVGHFTQWKLAWSQDIRIGQTMRNECRLLNAKM
ncbi:unnamed protein product, partial [Gongylonema pulchrum]|uniref:SCP domain-containing protein n=1 Tax=Gongylonema pulchrum TaxID=637853 RepID=A0A183E4K9_9BILA